MFAQLIMSGNLGRDPELRKTAGGTSVVKLSVVSNRRFGEGREDTFWADVQAFGKLAEMITERFSKGSPIMFSAYPRTESWETSDGQKRSKVVFNIDRMLSWGNSGGNGKNKTNNDDIEMPY